MTPRAGPEEDRSREDRRLAEAIRRGDRDAFDRFFGRYAKPLLGHLTGMTGDPEGAQDLLQETMIRVWKKIGAYEERGAFRAWVYRIATNLALTELRRGRYEKPGAEEAGKDRAWDGPTPEEEWERKDRARRLEDALRSLPDDQRAVMLLRVRREMSLREIGEVLAVPEGTVKSRIHYAVRRLRLALGGTAEEDREANHGRM